MAPTDRSLRRRSAPKHKQRQPPRTARKRISYREGSSSDSPDTHDLESHDEETDIPPLPPPQTSVAAPKPRRSRKRKSSESCVQSSAGRKRVRGNRGSGGQGVMKIDENSIQTTGKTIPWATLPYQILAAIFDYASRPLTTEIFVPTPSIAWLLQSSRCCRAFLEPALSALYYSPPLTPPSRAQALIEHLSTQDADSTLNYRAKIKYLEMEASSTLMHKFAGQDPLDLGRLIRMTPQLRGIGIHLINDDPKFRKTILMRMVNGKSAYQPTTFSALEQGLVRLHEWTWNQSLARQGCSLASLKELHTMSPFQTLKDLSFVNYDAGSSEKDRRREDILEEAINVLPNLIGLHFRRSTIVNSRLLRKLPKTLQMLEIMDCSSLKSPALSSFLRDSGKDLRQLILNHNHSLNLSFLTALGVDCPRLELLRIDLRYFNTFFTVQDSDPRYDALFKDGEIPMWPTSLQRLELFHLRKWSLRTAELFFRSLVDAAKSLADLRQLRIKATLEESGWRDRIGFRDTWTEKLQYVFQRKFIPPNPNFQSFATFEDFKRQQCSLQDKGSRKDQSDKTKVSRFAFSDEGQARLSHNELPSTKEASDESDSDVPLSKSRNARKLESSDGETSQLNLRRSKRVFDSSSQGTKSQPCRRRKRRSFDDSSSEDSALDDDGFEETIQSNHESTEIPDKIQGMCDVVDVLIDNLRPREQQLNEGDFLDEEASGDEDWNGDDDTPDEGGYAW